MGLAHFDFDYDGLLHLGRNDVAHLLIAPRSCRRLCLFCCRRHLPAPFFALAVFTVAVFAVADFGVADFAVADFAVTGFAVTGATTSLLAPRTPRSRSRATVLIWAISLRSWRSFFTPSFCPSDTWKRSRNNCSADVFSWCVSSSSLRLRIFSSSISFAPSYQLLASSSISRQPHPSPQQPTN